MDSSDWKLDIKIQPIGLNYTHPGVFRSDTLLACGELISLKEYEQAYKENAAKTVNDLTLVIGKGIQKNLTYIEDKKLADFLEHILILSRKGMNHKEFDAGYSIEERYRYSQNVANTINADYSEEDSNWMELKTDSDSYFNQLKKESFKETQVNAFSKAGNQKSVLKNLLVLIATLPIFLAGLVHNLIPYLLVKLSVEKMFKRNVFWSGVKMLLGGPVWLLLNLPIFWVLPQFISPEIGPWGSYFICLAYFLIVPPLTFVWSYKWKSFFTDTLRLMKADPKKLETYSKLRDELKVKISKFGF
jgi:hypothetical protein